MAGFIPEKTYKIITKLAPIITNDVLLENEGKFLLLKRRNEPAKGMWFTPGGRVHKNEKIVDSIRRVAKEELGIRKIRIKKFLGPFEVFWSPGKFGQKDIHCVTFAFLAEPVGELRVKMDSQHSKYDFFKKPPQGSHPFIKKIFYLAKKKDFQILFPGTYLKTAK